MLTQAEVKFAQLTGIKIRCMEYTHSMTSWVAVTAHAERAMLYEGGVLLGSFALVLFPDTANRSLSKFTMRPLPLLVSW